MRAYYVDATSGDDSNDGLSPDTAWKTTGKVSAEIGNGTFSGGDKILFKRGETWTFTSARDRINISGCSGTPENHITIGAYGSGDRPVFHGNDSGIYPGLIWRQQNDSRPGHYWTIRDIEFTNLNAYVTVWACSCHNWILDNLYFHDFGTTEEYPNLPGSGITFRYDAEHCLIQNCIIDNIASEGIYIGAALEPTDHTRSITIKDCVISNCKREGIDLKDNTTDCVIQNVTLYMNGYGSADDFQVSLGGQGHVMSDSHVYGTKGLNRYGIMLGAYTDYRSFSGRYITVENCVIEDCTGENGAGVRLGGSDNKLTGCIIANCTSAIRGYADDEGGKCVVKRNKFSGISGYPVYLTNHQGRYDLDHNRYVDGSDDVWYENFAGRDFDYVRRLGQESHGTIGDDTEITIREELERLKAKLQALNVNVNELVGHVDNALAKL